jgi:hypothetical protein
MLSGGQASSDTGGMIYRSVTKALDSIRLQGGLTGRSRATSAGSMTPSAPRGRRRWADAAVTWAALLRLTELHGHRFSRGIEERDLGQSDVLPGRDAASPLPKNVIKRTQVRPGQIMQSRGKQHVNHALADPQIIKCLKGGRLPFGCAVALLGRTLGVLREADELAQQLQPLSSATLSELVGPPPVIPTLGAPLRTGLRQIGQPTAECDAEQGDEGHPDLDLHAS